jgi:DNA repair protein RadC
MTTNKPHYLGHRQRAKEKFLKNDASKISDYELMELLLFASYPRKDVKPLAKIILKKFGSFAKAIHASKEELSQIEGVGQAVIFNFKLMQQAVHLCLKEEISKNPILGSWKALLDYLTVKMQHLKTEEFHVIYLNSKNEIIADEVQEKGTVSHTNIYIRKIIKQSLIHEASALILVHNHPSGNAKPSEADITLTQEIAQLAKPLAIKIHDHIIIADNEYFSFKNQGLLKS